MQVNPHRLATYPSNSLQNTPEKDVAGKMDFAEWSITKPGTRGGSKTSVETLGKTTAPFWINLSSFRSTATASARRTALPAIDLEVRELVRKMSLANPLW